MTKEIKLRSLANTVRGKDVQSAISTSMDEIQTFLANFCGPNALFAATVGETQNSVIDQFTKDGITILERLAADSPEFEICRRLIEVVGKRVDSRCHDGTTTGMMFAAACAKHLVGGSVDLDRPARREALEDATSFINKMTEVINNNTFTVDELIEEAAKHSDAKEDDIRRKVFYDTIMTSSKGDAELATKLTEVMLTLPEDLYGYMRFEHAGVETDERYEVIHTDADFVLRGNYQGNNAILTGNRFLGTEFNLDECDLLVTSESMIDGGAATQCVLSYITNNLLPTTKNVEEVDENGVVSTKEVEVPPEVELKRPLIILSRNSSYSQITQYTNYYNQSVKEWNRKIFCFQFFAEEDRSYQIVARAIAAMAGDGDTEYKPITEGFMGGDYKAAFIPCSFRNYGDVIEIGDLYTRDGRKFHPRYYDEKATTYQELLTDIKSTIDRTRERHSDGNPVIKKLVLDLVKVQHMLVSQNYTTLRIGSTTHELISNSTVMEDAIGASMSVIEEGLILSGYQKLLGLTLECADDYGIADLFRGALVDVLNAVYDLPDPSIDKSPESKTAIRLAHDSFKDKWMYNDATADDPFTAKSILDDIDGDVSIIQPASGYIEQLTRIKDIIIKLVSTYAVLTTKAFNSLS